jgi:hypothetical protein
MYVYHYGVVTENGMPFFFKILDGTYYIKMEENCYIDQTHII